MTQRVYWIGSSADCEVPQADAAWVEETWPKVACPACSTLLPQDHPKPIRVVLANESNVHRIGPTGLTAWPFATGGIERSLAEHMQLPRSDFALGEVVYKGEVLDSHWSCVCSARLRIPHFGDPGDRYTRCVHCGRTFGSATKTKWIRKEDIEGLRVFSGVDGCGLYVPEEVWVERKLAQWPRIQTRLIEVRSGVIAPRIEYELEDPTPVQRRVAAWRSGMR